MSNRHYWPTEGGLHLVEDQNGEVRLMYLYSDGRWGSTGLFSNATTDSLVQNGYLGVRTPFSEEAERAAFEAWYYEEFCDKDLPPAAYFQAGRSNEYMVDLVGRAWKSWLAAKRHERGL